MRVEGIDGLRRTAQVEWPIARAAGIAAPDPLQQPAAGSTFGAMTVLDWLLDSDPALRWQVLRDLSDAPPEVVAAERARVATEGWGARLLALRGDDGQWAGGTCYPADFRGDFSHGQPWTATLPTLTLPRNFGIDPAARRATRGRRLELRNRERIGARIVRDHDLRARGVARARAGDRWFGGGCCGAQPRGEVPARAPAVPAVEHRRGGRPGLAAVLVPDLVALRRTAGLGLLPRRRGRAGL